MLTSNIKTSRNDIKTLLRDAQELFREATTSTGGRADELRAKGLMLLDSATEKAQELQTLAMERSKAAAETTNEFVQQKPWQAVAVSAGVGLLLGLLLSRR